MRVSFGPHLLAGLLLLTFNGFAVAQQPAEAVENSLPAEVDGFRRAGSIRRDAALEREKSTPLGSAGDSLGCVGVEADYVSSVGEGLLVESFRCPRYSGAYSLLTLAARSLRDKQPSNPIKLNSEIGTATLNAPGSVAFFKGPMFIRVSERTVTPGSNAVQTLARILANRIDAGEADIPVLVKHLPQWEEVQGHAVYLAGFKSLSDILPNQPILNIVKSEGDADATAAAYGSAAMVIVEFNTPQLASDNDQKIKAGIEQLRSQGQPVPSAYRRVGNYSVFVFDADGEQVANSLIDQVKYEQVVTWLGDNPNLLEQAQRDYYQTTAGVLAAVVTASGLSLLACFAIGGLFGALLFTRRRAQQQAREAYSDAGGMLRLNIDEITPKSDAPKLLGSGQ